MVSDEFVKSLAIQQAMTERGSGIDDPTMMKEINKAELFKFLSRPDLQNKLTISTDSFSFVPKTDNNGNAIMDEKGQPVWGVIENTTILNPLTKELKISNLTEQEFLYVNELGDLASHLNDVGADPKKILLFRELFISTAPSKKGMFIKLSQSEFNIKKIETDTQTRRFFRRGKQEEQ